MKEVKYIVNTTYIIMPSMHGQWYKFMMESFIPSIEKIDLYGKVRFTRLLSEQEEKHFTYSLQIDCYELRAYHNYIKVTLPEYVEFVSQLFDAEVTHFVSLLKMIK